MLLLTTFLHCFFLGHMEVTVKPGPVDPSVLRLQRHHRSEVIWGGRATDKVLSCRQHLHIFEDGMEVDERVLQYVRLAGFYGVHRLTGGMVSIN